MQSANRAARLDRDNLQHGGALPLPVRLLAVGVGAVAPRPPDAVPSGIIPAAFQLTAGFPASFLRKLSRASGCAVLAPCTVTVGKVSWRAALVAGAPPPTGRASVGVLKCLPTGVRADGALASGQRLLAPVTGSSKGEQISSSRVLLQKATGSDRGFRFSLQSFLGTCIVGLSSRYSTKIIHNNPALRSGFDHLS